MNRHEELLAWWELGIEENKNLEQVGRADDVLEREFAVDQLDEVALDLMGKRVCIASSFIELCVQDEESNVVLLHSGVIEGTMNGAFYSRRNTQLPRHALGIYVNRPNATVASKVVDYAFVPFNDATLIQDIDASQELSDGLRNHIDTIVLGDVIKLGKLAKLFQNNRVMKSAMFGEVHVQYLNKILPLDDYEIELVAYQAYRMQYSKDGNKGVNIVGKNEHALISCNTTNSRRFKLHNSNVGLQLGIEISTSESDVFVPLLSIASIDMTLKA